MKLQKLIHIAIGIVCVGLLPRAQGVVPAPDGGYPGQNTAEGTDALFTLTSGGFNTAVGFSSLRNLTTGSFNTAVGAGALLSNAADENTATGAFALLSNTTGAGNTANGTSALLTNTTGDSNTAIGADALLANTDGHDNTATGVNALSGNTTGDFVDSGWSDVVWRGDESIGSPPSMCLHNLRSLTFSSDQMAVTALSAAGKVLFIQQIGPDGRSGWTEWANVNPVSGSALMAVGQPIIVAEPGPGAPIQILAMSPVGELNATSELRAALSLTWAPWQQLDTSTHVVKSPQAGGLSAVGPTRPLRF